MKYFDLTMLLIVLTLSAAMGVCQVYEANHANDACSILCGCGGGGDGCNCTIFEGPDGFLKTGKACDCKNCACGNQEVLKPLTPAQFKELQDFLKKNPNAYPKECPADAKRGCCK